MEPRSESRTLSNSTLAAGMEAVATQCVKVEELTEKEAMEQELKDSIGFKDTIVCWNKQFEIQVLVLNSPPPRVLSFAWFPKFVLIIDWGKIPLIPNDVS